MFLIAMMMLVVLILAIFLCIPMSMLARRK
jgi:hypothetical protein